MDRTASSKSLLHVLRDRRDKYRQHVGILFVIAATLLGEPRFEMFMPGIVLIVSGVLVRLWASGHIRKNEELATDGPYAIVRHPLYVGNILILCGFALASALWWSLPLLLVILAAFYPPAIAREDSFLERTFGESWRAWRSRTHALLPLFSSGSEWRKGRWSFNQSLRRNGEPLIAAFLMLCAAWLGSGV